MILVIIMINATKNVHIKTYKGVWPFGTVVNRPFVSSASHIKVPGFESHLNLQSSFLLMCTPRGSRYTWISATYIGDPD